jgi:hypothetical protein
MAAHWLTKRQGGVTLRAGHTGDTARRSIIQEKLSDASPTSADYVITRGQREIAVFELKPINYSAFSSQANVSVGTVAHMTNTLDLWGSTVANVTGLTVVGNTATNFAGNMVTNLARLNITNLWVGTSAGTGLAAHLAPLAAFDIATVAHHGLALQDLGAAPDWLQDAVDEIDAVRTTAIEEGRQSLSSELAERAKEIVSACAALGAPEPVADLDEDGNLEVFFKRGANGVLLIVSSTGVLQVFGNTEGDSWRSRYMLSGHTWRQHLATLVASII